MKKIFSIFLFIFFVAGLSFSQETALPAKEKFHLFLMAGQSNMAGRGKVEEFDRKIHPRVLMLSKAGEWLPAVDPIHYDKDVAGVGPGKSFALALSEQDTSVVIGLIPAACGGSPISTWEPGGYHKQTKSYPYDDAIKRTKRAMQDGVLKGILWHQGESDCKPELAEIYKGKLIDLIVRFRKEFDDPELPFIIGQMGQFASNPWDKHKAIVNSAQIEITKEITSTVFVASDSLSCKSDNIHFNAKSARELGRRYAKAYLDLKE